MERDKKQLKRTGNKVKPLHVADFIALGSKTTARQGELSDPKIKSKSSLISGTSSERKSDGASTSTSAIPAKKPKISSSSSSSHGKRLGAIGRKEAVKNNDWDAIAVEVDSADLVSKILEAEDCSDDERVEALICGAVKKLKSGRTKFDAPLYLGLQYLAKSRPFLFCSEITVEAFSSLLKRDMNVNFKAKGNNVVSILAANILMAAYKDESSWPEVFVKAYVEDSLGERVWVDHDYCKGFVDNILTAFNTKAIPKSMIIPERLFKPEACPSPPNLGTDDDESCSSMSMMETHENLDSVVIFPRYIYSEDSLSQHVIDVFKDQMTRRQPSEVSRNTLRFLVSTCGISEVRLNVSQKLEIWLQNPKLTKPAQELLLAVCLNCNQHNQHDVEVISQLVKIRIKAKPIINHYLQCMKELISQHPENLSCLLKHSIYNELSNSRNPNNMQLLAIIFQHSPDRAATELANCFNDFICNREDYLRALRGLLREIVRCVRHDLNFPLFCMGLTQERRDVTFLEFEAPLKEKILLQITDLIVLAIFLGISPTVKDQFTLYSRGEKKDLTALRNYQLQVANIQKDAVCWMYSIVPKLFKPERTTYLHCIHKLLFMEQMEHYYNKDGWPSEGDRMFLLRVASEVPLLEETLTRILITGLSRDHLFTAHDALELADQLVKRAAMTYFDNFPVLEFENTELCDIIFNLCAYHHPENITLPQGYHPPNLAISELYWKAWSMLLIIICHNPATFGDMTWKTCPMMRNLMEMCITNQFIFPPPTMALGEKADEIKSRELQMSQMEKEEILIFESHLAAASIKVAITETNSLLISKLISMDPHGPARKPPAVVLEQLKAMNAKFKLGDLLCHSRNPDFLLDVIQRQGTTQSMSWLSELVESSASSFNMLPVQCLCEFLISEGAVSDANEDEKSLAKKKKKQEQLLFHLQKLLYEPESEPQETIEVISYFMKRLSSQQNSARILALKGLNMLLSQRNKSSDSGEEEMIQEKDTNEHNWLLKSLPLLPHFQVIRSQISIFLRQACQIENDPQIIVCYINFLATHTPDHNLQEFADLALDMAQMIVERPTIVNTILPSEETSCEHNNDFLASVSEIFFKYLSAAKIPSKEVYSWSESQDQILIQWSSGESATMHILVVHAMIIVLTYGPPLYGVRSYFDALLEIWFPVNADQPKAFLVDTSEEALLLPDWLKLRMIRSSVGVLVDAALKDLDPSQLVLFIQSFGIPVSSMSKLLRTLDVAVEVDSYSVEQAVLDKSYMSQLVEVQHRRGATGGEKFAQLLLDGDSVETPMDTDILPNQTTVIQRAPPKPPAAINIQSVSVSLVKLLGLNSQYGILSGKQEQEIFKGLQKALSKDILDRSSESGAISVFIQTCEQILRTDTKMAFLQALHKKSYYSSVLFRLATASQAKVDITKSQLAQKLKWICQQIIYVVSPTSSSLLTVASQFYNKHKPPETKKPVPWKMFVQQYGMDNSDNIKQIVQEAETKDALRLEEVMQCLVKNAISKGNTKPLMNAMTNITVKRLTTSISPSIKTFNRSKFCFFVDWLECLEPKIISSFPESQCHLLFSLISKEKEPIVVPFRPYLLALLIHQSSWEILHYYIQTVLNPPSANIKFDPTSVLDFLYACIYIPKIWQGRYKKKNKSGSEEDILALSEKQMHSVINYILEEALMKCSSTVFDQPSSSNSLTSGFVSIEGRMKLLMKCLALKSSLINSSVQYLLEVINDSGNRGKLGHELLLQGYHQIPSVLTLIPDAVTFLSEGTSEVKTNCKLDIISHTLLLALARTDSSKQCLGKMVRIEFICKKMASNHPLLLLRQLPMMTSLLRGRVHLDYHQFRQQNHVTLFSCYLSIIELLPPLLFKAEYCADLNNILSLYMDVFQAYGSPKEIAHLLSRFFAFLLLYLTARPSSARLFIQQYIDSLLDLTSHHQDLFNFRSILTGLCMHSWEASSSGAEAKVESALHDIIAGLHFQNISQTQIPSISHRLNHGNSDEVALALQELEGISYKKPTVLEHVVDNLKSLMQDNNAQFRMTAFNLVMRYVKNNPSRGKLFISSYLQCLESEEVDVVLTALDHLPEFTILVQEYASILLQKTFSIGMMKNMNTAGQIKATISYLVAQSGC
ncbi:hypothetical protein JTE90_008385 [Oedothorax gibbosus]|uniref:Integrator complex subunit 1 n=1 Tax=Oedothorax gibbosus TaxID=931172 RepID=A0AAV6V5X1_9ARAC|nr:hypothetical protein JTE90_008385 [Oedothorax gibbosus]